ncbi:hypothetical protein Ddc_01160 [Ditylenchus destructor]|nr:hypothetical protein Ddc_01160 [Ditylenchus destructor]
MGWECPAWRGGPRHYPLSEKHQSCGPFSRLPTQVVVAGEGWDVTGRTRHYPSSPIPHSEPSRSGRHSSMTEKKTLRENLKNKYTSEGNQCETQRGD